MILVRTVFQTKWGKADELVASMKEMMTGGPAPEPGPLANKTILLTDLSGEFHTVVMEAQYESMAAWEQFRAQMFSGSDSQSQDDGNMDSLIISGRQEFYTVEAEL